MSADASVIGVPEAGDRRKNIAGTRSPQGPATQPDSTPHSRRGLAAIDPGAAVDPLDVV